MLRLSRWATEESADVIRLPFSAPPAYGGQLRKLVLEAIAETRAGRRVIVVSQQAQRLAELFGDEDAPVSVGLRAGSDALPLLTLVQGSLSDGWRFGDDGRRSPLLTDTEVFGFTKQRRAPPRRTINREAFLAELVPGAYVVHIDHGIARFAGVIRKSVDGYEREYLELHYAEGDQLFVPTDQLDRVSRYIGPSDREPRPTRLASGEWQRAKPRVRNAVQELARDLLALYAAREVLTGYAHSPDNAWQMELEASFPYVETPDQVAAIAAVKQDMESQRPMDRLVCGDVGYGKTEVAVRAAFKAVMDGKQVAVLVPTTVLAQQHFKTFRERLAAFPVRVEMLSRFRSDAEQTPDRRGACRRQHRHRHRHAPAAAEGREFKNLGLVVDRRGAALRRGAQGAPQADAARGRRADAVGDADPAHAAHGARRHPRHVDDGDAAGGAPADQDVRLGVRRARWCARRSLREMERGGQVYFVHNRVHNIDLIAAKLQDIVPEARIGIGHGQMDEDELERAMLEFTDGKSDVLVCTTIIESGLDIPNVNTIIINQADKLGLAQLYQLRGRVGRGAHRAYAYLLYDRKAR